VFIGGGSAQVGLAVAMVHDWEPGPGSVVSWQPSPASLAKVRQAPISPVPIAYMQADHLRGHCEFADRGLDYSRIVMGSLDAPGRCDIRAMTYVINAHLRRHETYHSWFDYKDAKNIVRHTIANPRDIEFVPIEHGQMTPTEWRELVLATPDPLQWDCFRFGSIQHADHFTLFVIIDHLHTDPALITGLYVEILTMYRALVSGAPPISLPPTASHDDFCVRESQYAAAVSLDSPEVRKWIEFAENNGGALPDFPLPLGDQSISCGGDTVVERLMDQDQTAQFESRCAAAGTRFSGGLFACAALTQYELTGLETYYGLTPIDKRRTPAEYVTMGWFTGIVPFTVPVDPTSFEETARATQASFDSNADLANVPYDRVLELAPWLRRYGPNFTMLNYMDAGLPPLSAVAASALEGATATAYNDGRSPAYLYMSVIRLFDEVSLMVSFPNNPIARESVTRYMETMKFVFGRVAEGRDAVASLTDAANA
jgi:2-O-sulfo trehalose long-chain-acyltransferase